MIYFKKIKWRNFLSTGNIFTEIDLSKPGSTLIIGENGSGKSTLLDALTFGLFGKPFRNINKPQLLNSITKKDLIVEIEFEIGTNKYKIVRGIKPTLFEVYCNDVLLNQSSDVKDYQEILETQILRINQKSFCQVVLLGSASFVPFMQLKAGPRRAIIEDLLDLQIFTTMNTILKEKIQDNNNEILKIDNSRNVVKTKIEMATEHLKEIQFKNENFLKIKNKQIEDINSCIHESQQELHSLTNKIQNLEKESPNIDSFKSKLEYISSLKIQLETKQKILHKEISFFSDHDNCPTCKQEINKKFSCDLISNKNEQLLEIETGLSKLNQKQKDENLKLEKLVEIQKNISNLKQEAADLNLKISHYKNHIEFIKKDIENHNKQYTENNSDKISNLELEQSKLNTIYNNLQEDKHILSAASLMLKDGGIKTKIINQYIPIINKLINKYLSMMDFYISFEMNNEFEETLKSRYRDDFVYESFSEGEKQKIDLALLFTWRAIAKMRNSMNTNLLIMDEVFDSSLDMNGTDQLMSIIQTLANDNSLFIISHKEAMIDKFNDVIKFKKYKNFSQMEKLV
jgi:DNA repair exonuclease SbcCD ATPase subunit